MEFAAAVRTSAEQKELILKLEHDLSTVQAMSSLPRPDADGSEVSNMGNIPEPIKEASATFIGRSPGWNGKLMMFDHDVCVFVIRIPHMSSQNETSPLAIKWPRSSIYDQSGDNIKLFRNRWKGQTI